MFGDERASAKEISLFLVRLQEQGLTASETTKLEAQVYTQVYLSVHRVERRCMCTVQSPYLRLCKAHQYWVLSRTSNFSTIGQAVLEIRRWGVGRMYDRMCKETNMMSTLYIFSRPI